MSKDINLITVFNEKLSTEILFNFIKDKQDIWGRDNQYIIELKKLLVTKSAKLAFEIFWQTVDFKLPGMKEKLSSIFARYEIAPEYLDYNIIKLDNIPNKISYISFSGKEGKKIYIALDSQLNDIVHKSDFILKSIMDSFNEDIYFIRNFAIDTNGDIFVFNVSMSDVFSKDYLKYLYPIEGNTEFYLRDYNQSICVQNDYSIDSTLRELYNTADTWEFKQLIDNLWSEYLSERTEKENKGEIPFKVTKPSINLLQSSDIRVAIKAIRTCYESEANSDSELDLNAKCNSIGDKDKELLKKILESKHESTLEHIVYSFEIKGISRAVLQELVRHRIASYSVKSSRYTLSKELIKTDTPFLSEIDIASMTNKKVSKTYDFMRADDFIYLDSNLDIAKVQVEQLELLRKTISQYGGKSDNYKGLLPESWRCNLVLTINARSLRNFLKLRLSNRAYYQIRELATLIFDTIPESHKEMLFSDIN